jgi:hypothetical protein
MDKLMDIISLIAYELGKICVFLFVKGVYILKTMFKFLNLLVYGNDYKKIILVNDTDTHKKYIYHTVDDKIPITLFKTYRDMDDNYKNMENCSECNYGRESISDYESEDEYHDYVKEKFIKNPLEYINKRSKIVCAFTNNDVDITEDIEQFVCYFDQNKKEDKKVIFWRDIVDVVSKNKKCDISRISYYAQSVHDEIIVSDFDTVFSIEPRNQNN